MIAIIDYGLGNLGSIGNMLNYIGADSIIIKEPSQLKDADKIILPGVGAFDTGITNLKEQGWLEPLDRMVKVEKKLVLGICLGMQLMTNSSEEGVLPGLGWIDAEATRLEPAPGSTLKVPSMGWCATRVAKPSSFFETDEENRFYFVHSYAVRLNEPSDGLLFSDFEEEFCSGFLRDNILGLQFHPEKSHKFGIRFFRKFVDYSF